MRRHYLRPNCTVCMCALQSSNRWKTELVSVSENGIGGFKEVVFMITGQGAYSKMKYESGVHRVQRVPETESGGRIHTSTATVAVMPEARMWTLSSMIKNIRIDVMQCVRKRWTVCQHD